jgi:methylmalonyl-CoA mutase N-terminal domain/subunit
VPALRASRDATAVEAAVAEVRRTADTDANLLPAIREALAVRATVGEVCGALRELWGTYDQR